MTRKRYIHRVRNRIGGNVTQRTPGAAYVGYFELREHDGIKHWTWDWATYAKQDRRAEVWIYNELLRLGERLAA